jgi:cobaltochelatase CobS
MTATAIKKPLKDPRADLTDPEKLLIPKINSAYHFGDMSNEVQFDIVENRKVLLTGHMGCGKTSLFEQFAAQISQPVMRVNMNGQTTIADFVGFWTAKGGETVWVDGVLPLCMRRGYWCIIDEIDFAEASILSVLNSVAEKDGKLFLKEKGHEIIVPHKDFRLLATANTVGIMENCRHIYQGANIMNRALLDRFRVYHVGYLPPAQEASVLTQTVKDLPLDAAQVLVKLANEIRTAFNKEELSSTFSLRQLIDFAELMTRKKNKDKDGKLDPNAIIMQSAEVCIYSKISREDGEVVKGMVQRNLMKKAA